MSTALATAGAGTADEQPARRGHPSRGRWAAAVGSGWLPTGVAILLTFGVLHFYGVPLPTTATFLAYICLGVTLPGTLLYRLLRRGAGWLPGDLAAGTAVGYAAEVLTYIPARTIGAPLLVLVWPAGCLALFLLVPGLRTYWRASTEPGDRTPLPVAWSLAAGYTVLLGWSMVAYFWLINGFGGAADSFPDQDFPFHLALIGEAKHHMPLMTPWVANEPVYYHWFVYADMAATSWVTGIEPSVLLLRLSILPFLAAFLVLLAALARKLTGRWWTAPAAAVGAFLLLIPNPYPWQLDPYFSTYASSPYEDGSLFRRVIWTSPTQTFGQMLFAGLVLAVLGLLERRRDVRQWVLVVIMMAAVTGGKATFLPMLLAGLGLLWVIRLVTTRRVDWTVTALGAVNAAFVLFAQRVLFGGASQGLGVDPLHQMRMSGAPVTVGFATSGTNVSHARLVAVLCLTLLAWGFVWVGAAGLAVRRRYLDPAVVLLVGVAVAGVGATLVFGGEGGAEGWFMNSARPYLTLAAICGAATVLPALRITRRMALALTASVLAGMLVVFTVRALSDPKPPTGHGMAIAWQLAWPYLVLAASAVGFGVALILANRRWPIARSFIPALVLTFLAGVCLYSPASLASSTVSAVQRQTWRNVLMNQWPQMTQGTVEAGHWLRAHSDPSDLVATNAHCAPPFAKTPGPQCENLHFALAAFSERRFLVEGWGFTADAHVQSTKLHKTINFAPYWRPDVLADNDAAFSNPSAQTMGRLRAYGVSWLWVDDTVSTPGPGLDHYATLRYQFGPTAIYQLNN